MVEPFTGSATDSGANCRVARLVGVYKTYSGAQVKTAAAESTSVAVVAGTAAAAAVTQVAELDATQVPWELVRYTIPGVILGGQIAPRLAGRLDDRQIERAAAALFAVVGAAFALKAATG